ncbi:MAG TPA: hypothetical protein DDW18_02765 [Firmicutes bacterium]|nr:hypothetical protein [Bacillota bacterium]HBN00050.1 hypothetical protein [Bacillota bacterium]
MAKKIEKAEEKTSVEENSKKGALQEKKEKEGVKVYHVSKRSSDNKWKVSIRGSDKVIKLFDTKVEAEEYCTRMAKNQGATLQIHNSKGANKGKISKAIVKGGKK